MSLDLQIVDMAGARPEHSTVIGNTFLDIPRFVMEVITEKNKDKLKIVHFPNLEITFDELFAEVDLEY